MLGGVFAVPDRRLDILMPTTIGCGSPWSGEEDCRNRSCDPGGSYQEGEENHRALAKVSRRGEGTKGEGKQPEMGIKDGIEGWARLVPAPKGLEPS